MQAPDNKNNEYRIVRNGDNLDMYVGDFRFTLTEEQFIFLSDMYYQLRNNISNPFCAYHDKGETHFLIKKD